VGMDTLDDERPAPGPERNDRRASTPAPRSPRPGRSSAAGAERIRQRILDAITESVEQRGYPPSIRELASTVGLSSPSSVHGHLAVLEAQGLLHRDPARPRALAVAEPAGRTRRGMGMLGRSLPSTAEGAHRSVPVLGLVGAGTGVLAEQQDGGEALVLDQSLLGSGEHFALEVRGESMRDAGILGGDLVIVRRQPDAPDGSVVVAGLPGDEGTVKFLRRGSGSKVTLVPANPDFAPIELDADELVIYGQVVSVIRRLS